MIMDEVTANNYLQWPAPGSDRIGVFYWCGNRPVTSHKHEFIEIAYFSRGTCIHKYHGASTRLIPGDIFVIAPHEEHSYEIFSDTIIYNCIFYPDALGEDWERIKNVSGIYDMLIVEPFYRIESGLHDLLHLTPVEADVVKCTAIW